MTFHQSLTPNQSLPPNQSLTPRHSLTPSLSLPQIVQTADALIAGRLEADGGEIVDLEKELARNGDRKRARDLHTVRSGVDKKQANRILSGGDGGVKPAAKLKLAKRLAGDKAIGLARRLLKQTRVGLPKDSAEIRRDLPEERTVHLQGRGSPSRLA